MAQKDTGAHRPGKTKETTLTPLMAQYQEIKSRYPGMILFFRLGDFYELFGEDALEASPILEVVLTRRQETPMCGVPYHAVNAYLRKLIKAGRKVAICEQLEEPSAGRGIVKRGVVRVITPGTILEDNLLEARQNNFLVAVYPSEKHDRYGLAAVDISTGEFLATELAGRELENEIMRLAPGEIIAPQHFAATGALSRVQSLSGAPLTPLEDWYYTFPEAQSRLFKHLKLQSLKPIGLENRPLAVCSAGGVLAYIEKTQIDRMPPLAAVRYYSLDHYLLLDSTAVRNLELVEGLTTRTRENSLLSCMDATLTAMGGRLLRQWVLQPLLSLCAIERRHQAVGYLLDEGIGRRSIRDGLKKMADIERILGRLASGAAGPREVAALKTSLSLLSVLCFDLSSRTPLAESPESIRELAARLAMPDDVINLIAAAFVDEPPATLKDGGVIRPGCDAELDELRRISTDSRELISRMESGERQRTGINTLKIGYTSVFGYYLEVTKSNLHLVPQEYIRKQTVAGGERFITPELKAFEEKVLSADEKILRIEERIFRAVREGILVHAARLQDTAAAVAELDIFATFAENAALYDYCRPVIDESYDLEIRDGRHPVIERAVKSGSFVPNDVLLNGTTDQLILLTGPNMAGKSTYLRQVALIVIMAQMGSYVPCASCRIGLVDRIFTRIGAGDNLSGGESTFMVEMHETANILNQNTPRSLIILDEVGRGTSTYDGISIAWATVEYLSSLQKKNGNGPKVLFATHYFELTGLQGTLPGVRNYNVSVKEWQGNVLFLHKIVEGAADRSYGIHVAQLAGLPQEVIRRGNEILVELEQNAMHTAPAASAPQPQLDLFAAQRPVFMDEFDKIDVNSITPLEALQILSRWKKA